MSGAAVRELPPGPERDAYLPLLELADDSVAQVRSYYQTGTLFALDADDGSPMGMILAIPHAEGTVELKAVAVQAQRKVKESARCYCLPSWSDCAMSACGG